MFQEDSIYNSGRILRAALYERVSTEEQSLRGYSIDTQHAALVEHCNKNKLKIVDTYCDAGVSGAKPPLKRPALKRLIDDVKDGKIDIIIFTKLDRYFRDVAGYFETQKILDKHGVVWDAIWERYSTTDANGRMSITIYLAIAQNEREKTAERINAVFEHKRKNKEVTFGSHLVPFGYKIEQAEGGARKLVKDPEVEDVVQMFWDLAVKYNNVGHAAKTVSLEYGITKRKSKWFEISRNSIYSGVYKNVKDYCPAYVSHEDWLKLQDRETRIKQTKRNRVYLFSGLIVCPKCGHTLACTYTPTYQKSGYREYQRYRCHRKADGFCSNGKTLSEIKVEKWLLKNLASLMESEIARVEIEMTKPRKKPKTNTQALKERMRRLEVVYMSGAKSDEEYLSELKEIKDAIAKAEKECAESDEPHDRDLTNLKQMLETDFESIYATLDAIDKQRFWHTIIKEIHFDENSNHPTHVDFK